PDLKIHKLITVICNRVVYAGPPLNVKDAAGSLPAHGGEYAAVGGVQVSIIRHEGVVEQTIGAAPVLQVLFCAEELNVAIGTQVGSGEGAPINRDREGERYGSDAHLAVVARISGTRYDYCPR